MKKIFYILLLFFFLFPITSKSLPSDPLQVRTQNPLYLQFLAMPLENANVLDKNQMVVTASTTFSNVFEYHQVGVTQLNFDMELWRTALTFNYGLTKNLDLKFELPFITSAGGFLDSIVQSYHDTFGLPNGGRNLVPNNSYAFSLTQNGTTLFNNSASAFGLSDITLRAKYQVFDFPVLPITFALATYIKFPTGVATHGLTSGHTDFGTSLFMQTDIKRLHFSTQVGGAFLSGSDQVGAILTKTYFSFGQSAAFEVSKGFVPLVQLNGNTSVFHDVSATELSDIALDLNIGFTGNLLKDKLFYQTSFGEDVSAVGPSVDFSLLTLIGFRY